jgi:hypothetical protein
MSQTLSPSSARCYGLARVARVWTVSRASVYRSGLALSAPNHRTGWRRRTLIDAIGRAFRVAGLQHAQVFVGWQG